jgi:hypothetical protein
MLCPGPTTHLKQLLSWVASVCVLGASCVDVLSTCAVLLALM